MLSGPQQDLVSSWGSCWGPMLIYHWTKEQRLIQHKENMICMRQRKMISSDLYLWLAVVRPSFMRVWLVLSSGIFLNSKVLVHPHVWNIVIIAQSDLFISWVCIIWLRYFFFYNNSVWLIKVLGCGLLVTFLKKKRQVHTSIVHLVWKCWRWCVERICEVGPWRGTQLADEDWTYTRVWSDSVVCNTGKCGGSATTTPSIVRASTRP